MSSQTPAVEPAATPVAGKPRYDRSIVEGPLRPAVWKIAWPTMLTNVIGGLQGMVDHALVGNLVGFKANAAIGVSWQIFLVVIVFISSLFTGMSVLVARFAGAGDEEKVNRTVYQAFLTAIFISLGIMAPIGYFVSPALLNLVNAAPDVKAEALPFLRIMFVFSLRHDDLLHAERRFAFRRRRAHADDARYHDDRAQSRAEHRSHSRAWSGSCFRHQRRGDGNVHRFGIDCHLRAVATLDWRVGYFDSAWRRLWTKLADHQIDLQVWTADRHSGNRDEHRRRVYAGVHWVARSECCSAGCVRSFLHRAFLSDHVDVGGTDGRGCGGRGAEPGRKETRSRERRGSRRGAFWICGRCVCRVFFLFLPRQLLAIFGMHDPAVVDIGVQLLRVLSVSGLLIAVALTYTGGLQGTGDTRSPLYISIISQMVVPLGACFVIQQTGTLDPLDIWLAILAGHATRCVLSVIRFRQGKWRTIAVE